MTLNEYQQQADTTRVHNFNPNDALNYNILGLTGEAGEIANKYKKILRDQKGIVNSSNIYDLADEAGDVLWYLGEFATALGFTLQEIAEINLNKLAKRKEAKTLSGSGDKR